MAKRAEIVLDAEEREVLERWARRPKTSQALAFRCRVVLAAAEGAIEQGDRVLVGLQCVHGRKVAGSLRRPRYRWACMMSRGRGSRARLATRMSSA